MCWPIHSVTNTTTACSQYIRLIGADAGKGSHPGEDHRAPLAVVRLDAPDVAAVAQAGLEDDHRPAPAGALQKKMAAALDADGSGESAPPRGRRGAAGREPERRRGRPPMWPGWSSRARALVSLARAAGLGCRKAAIKVGSQGKERIVRLLSA